MQLFDKCMDVGSKPCWREPYFILLCISSIRCDPILAVKYLVIFVWLYLMVVLFYVMFTNSYLRISRLPICLGIWSSFTLAFACEKYCVLYVCFLEFYHALHFNGLYMRKHGDFLFSFFFWGLCLSGGIN